MKLWVLNKLYFLHLFFEYIIVLALKNHWALFGKPEKNPDIYIYIWHASLFLSWQVDGLMGSQDIVLSLRDSGRKRLAAYKSSSISKSVQVTCRVGGVWKYFTYSLNTCIFRYQFSSNNFLGEPNYPKLTTDLC